MASSNLTHKTMLFWKMPPFKENSTSPSAFSLHIPGSSESDSQCFPRPVDCLSEAAWAMLTQHYEGPTGSTGRMKSFHQRCRCLTKQINKKNQTWRSNFYLKIIGLHLCVCMCVSQTSLHSSGPCSFLTKHIHREMAFVDLSIKKSCNFFFPHQLYCLVSEL